MNILNQINNKLWIITTLLIFLSSIYFTIKLKLIQLDFKKMFKYIHNNNSSFKSLMLSLAGRIGIGSISGIALAIYLGGPGTIFWIWLISLLSATLTYAETYLAIKYKEIDTQNNTIGGPAYYIKKGLNNKRLGAIYSFLIILSYIFGFMSIQSNTITRSITNIIPNISPTTIGLILSIISLIIIFGGINKITNATSKIVPIMTLFYFAITIYIIIINYKIIPIIITNIIKRAWNYKSFTTGFLTTMLLGIQKGIFSSESGLGTGAIAASSNNSKNPIKEGYIQMLGIYITSFIICTSTAIIVLTSNYQFLNFTNPNGIEIATYAFNYHLPNNGTIILVISIILFAFSTILSGYYYGETSLKYFNKLNKLTIILLKLLTITIIFIGSISSPNIIWEIINLLTAILSIINIYAIFSLKKEITK